MNELREQEVDAVLAKEREGSGEFNKPARSSARGYERDTPANLREVHDSQSLWGWSSGRWIRITHTYWDDKPEEIPFRRLAV